MVHTDHLGAAQGSLRPFHRDSRCTGASQVFHLARRMAGLQLLALSVCLVMGTALAQPHLEVKKERCKLTKELEEGPFYLPTALLLRSNITEAQPGIPLTLQVLVEDPDCKPLPGIIVDIWSANSTGFYSGYARDAPKFPKDCTTAKGNPCGFGDKCTTPDGKPCGFPGPPHGGGDRPHPHPHPHHPEPTTDETFLRGIALTAVNGVAEFQTIIPGWYPGRAVHIHVKVHAPQINTTRLSDSHVIHTGQFFFPEDILSQMEGLDPYTQDTVHRVLNKDDHDFQQDPTQILDVALAHPDSLANGATGKISVVIDQFRAEVEPVAHESMLPVAR
ncbi:hypothetical protein WJX73_003450 [Symbiochloris irregularis]|uniref:Intradiol ring-cleavage dioxygenases domain-containing protein n=1 Tax=Symbiochloris irregularis TaxID=706552 RepID=A0AAW1NG08_9CHLO